MEGKKKGCAVACKRGRKGVMFAILSILMIAVAAVAGSNLTEAKVQKAQKTSSDQVNEENAGCEIMALNPLRREEYPEINDAVREYYEQQKEEASFVDAYEDVSIYTKQGIYKGTYVVFARYNMKIKDIYTKVPGLGTLYVTEDSSEGYQVSATVDDEKVKSYIQVIAGHEDVQALMEETQGAYHEAAQSDALLQEALADLKNAYEDSTM